MASRTGRPPGRPPVPDDEKLVVRVGARFSADDLLALHASARRAGQRVPAFCRAVLERAALSVPELPAELQEDLLDSGHQLNDLVYRLHTKGERLRVEDVPAALAALRLHRRTIERARQALAEATP